MCTTDRHDELVSLLTEIRDTLLATSGAPPKPKPRKVDPDLSARNLAAIKHEMETPMREHGECCSTTEREP